MENTKSVETQTQDKKKEKGPTGNSIKRSITGGLIGAAVGYVATPENGKKLLETFQPEKLKNSGSGLGQAVKEKSKKAVGSIKNSTGKIFNKKEDVDIKGYSNEEDQTEAGNETSLDSPINENKDSSHKENENMTHRLDRLEAMLTKLIEEKNGGSQDQNEQENNSTEQPLSSGENKQDNPQKQEGSLESSGDETSKESYLQGPLNEDSPSQAQGDNQVSRAGSSDNRTGTAGTEKHKQSQSQLEKPKDKQENQSESDNQKKSKNAQTEADIEMEHKQVPSSSGDVEKYTQTDAATQAANEDYESLKKENEKLQDRLSSIEELLTKVLHEKTNQGKTENSSQNEGSEKDDFQKKKHLNKKDAEDQGKGEQDEAEAHKKDDESKQDDKKNKEMKDEADNQGNSQETKEKEEPQKESNVSEAGTEDSKDVKSEDQDIESQDIDHKEKDQEDGDEEAEVENQFDSDKDQKNKKYHSNENTDTSDEDNGKTMSKSNKSAKDGQISYYNVLSDEEVEETYLHLDGLRKES
ncbi:GvpT/GvpP family gas vesicle accessory protein [Peribacillus sp. SCS-155]|uniref:GvpT/GvpP family gas vesicle accessory protein n=1 Tax=Peribacillus sedimenti TaxID=3115297 RepID=UPI0039069F7E